MRLNHPDPPRERAQFHASYKGYMIPKAFNSTHTLRQPQIDGIKLRNKMMIWSLTHFRVEQTKMLSCFQGFIKVSGFHSKYSTIQLLSLKRKFLLEDVIQRPLFGSPLPHTPHPPNRKPGI